MSSLTAKLGFTVGNALLYVDGGGALGGVNHDAFDAAGLVDTEASFRSVNVGWTAGAGVSYALTDHLTGDLSYSYYDLGSAEFPMTWRNDTAYWLSHNAATTAQVVSAGLNYRF